MASRPQAKSAAEGASLDTAAQKGHLFAIKNLRQAINSGKKLPAKSRAEADAAAKKEAMQTFFLAGFIKSANASTLELVNTPLKLAAFLAGYFGKHGAPGSSHGTGALRPYRGPDQAVTPAQRVQAGPKPAPATLPTPAPIPMTTAPTVGPSAAPATLADFINLAKKGPGATKARLMSPEGTQGVSKIDPVDANNQVRRQLIEWMKQEHAAQFGQPQAVNA